MPNRHPQVGMMLEQGDGHRVCVCMMASESRCWAHAVAASASAEKAVGAELVELREEGKSAKEAWVVPNDNHYNAANPGASLLHKHHNP
jgi:hypothetical protein